MGEREVGRVGEREVGRVGERDGVREPRVRVREEGRKAKRGKKTFMNR